MASSAALGGASAPSSAEIWMTTPPLAVGDVEFPTNSVVYERQVYELPPRSFLDTNWYLGIILVALLVLVAYILLALWVCHRFQYLDQRKARKVVGQAYLASGFFELDRCIDGGARGSARVQRSRRRSGERGAETAVFSDDSSGSLDEDEGADSSSSGSDSSTTSESVSDAVVELNPLRLL
ncbi:hypothetical protein LSCM1_07198 [Leishmania martiniquensis]|uniref:Uncharacterized protein n=1 Tax=Leishmania martiniquensis TaxID=1580590 RepID=A0A836HWW0_9TRYP|nr:hypothetical protein LSCM1_07198 [Leishmania martiniquensis]